MKFTKMQGLGNDYLYVYGEPQNPEELSIRRLRRNDMDQPVGNCRF